MIYNDERDLYKIYGVFKMNFYIEIRKLFLIFFMYVDLIKMYCGMKFESINY